MDDIFSLCNVDEIILNMVADESKLVRQEILKLIKISNTIKTNYNATKFLNFVNNLKNINSVEYEIECEPEALYEEALRFDDCEVFNIVDKLNDGNNVIGCYDC